MRDYTKIAQLAKAALKANGTKVTFTRTVETAFNPQTGTETTVPLIYGAEIVASTFTSAEINGTSILSSDLKMLMESLTTVPLLNDKLVFDSVTYRISNIRSVSPAGTPVLYIIGVRR